MIFSYQSQPFQNVCGQAVVAMVAGCPVAEVVAEIGRRKTFPSDLKRALANRGWTMTPARTQLPNWPNRPALLRCNVIQNHRMQGHWVLWTGDEMLDPADSGRKTFGPNVCGSFYLIEKTNPHPSNGKAGE